MPCARPQFSHSIVAVFELVLQSNIPMSKLLGKRVDCGVSGAAHEQTSSQCIKRALPSAVDDDALGEAIEDERYRTVAARVVDQDVHERVDSFEVGSVRSTLFTMSVIQ